MKRVIVTASTADQMRRTYISRLGDHVCEKLLRDNNMYAEARETDDSLIISVYEDDSANNLLFSYDISKSDIECNEEDMSDDVATICEDIINTKVPSVEGATSTQNITASTDDWKEFQQAAREAVDLQEVEHEFEVDVIEDKVLRKHGVSSAFPSTDGSERMLFIVDENTMSIDYWEYEDAVKSMIVDCTSFAEFEQEYDKYIQNILQ